MAYVYVVEDDKNISEIESFALKNAGHTVAECASGKEFHKLMRDRIPDMILLDVMLPDEDGLEILRKIRQTPETRRVPVIMVTAKTTELDKVKGLDLGADDYITKPFSATYLKARVKNLLAQRQKLQTLYRQNLMQAGAVAAVADEQSIGNVQDNPQTDKSAAMSPNDRKFMDKLVGLMEQNMDNGELVVDDLVRELAVSRSVFFKKLKTLTGLAPIEFIKEMRIKRATQLIETGEFNMTQISYMVGINDPRYFSKCFKAQVGMTPTEYRDRVGR